MAHHNQHNTPWDDEKDAWLRKHYPQNGAKFCAEHLGMTPRAIYRRAQHIGIKAHTGRGCVILSPKDVRYIRENRKGETMLALSERFGVHVSAIHSAYHGTTHARVV